MGQRKRGAVRVGLSHVQKGRPRSPRALRKESYREEASVVPTMVSSPRGSASVGFDTTSIGEGGPAPTVLVTNGEFGDKPGCQLSRYNRYQRSSPENQ